MVIDAVPLAGDKSDEEDCSAGIHTATFSLNYSAWYLIWIADVLTKSISSIFKIDEDEVDKTTKPDSYVDNVPKYSLMKRKRRG